MSSTVLPALCDVGNIYVGGKTHISAMNLAHQYSVNFFDINLLGREEFEFYFLALPTHEVSGILKRIPNKSKIWLEKPLTELSSVKMDELERIVENSEFDIHCGLLKRTILNKFPDVIECLQYNCNVPIQSNWKNIQTCGANWVDGVHAIDMLYCVNKKSFCNVDLKICNNFMSLQNDKYHVRIGDYASDTLIINGKDHSKLLTYKFSKRYLRRQFLNFTSTLGNFADVMVMQRQFLSLFQKEMSNED